MSKHKPSHVKLGRAPCNRSGCPRVVHGGFEEMIEGVNSGWIAFGIEDTERVEGTTSANEVFAAANAAK